MKLANLEAVVSTVLGSFHVELLQEGGPDMIADTDNNPPLALDVVRVIRRGEVGACEVADFAVVNSTTTCTKN